MTSTTSVAVADHFNWGIDLRNSEFLSVTRNPGRRELTMTLDIASVMKEATSDSRAKYDPAELLDAAELTFVGLDWFSDLEEDPCSDSWMIADCRAEPGIGDTVDFTFGLIASVGTPQVAWGKFAVTANDFVLTRASRRSFAEGDDPMQAIALLETPGTPGYRKALRTLSAKDRLPALAQAMADPTISDAIKLAIIDIFHKARWPESAPTLLGLLDSPTVKLRAQAVQALGVLREPSVAPRLLAILTAASEPDAVRSEAVLALGNLRYRPAIDALKSALRDDSARMRTTASRALKLLQ